VIYADHVRYKIASWNGREPETFELPASDFVVVPDRGPRPMHIGFIREE
jgi:hypothetical protein